MLLSVATFTVHTDNKPMTTKISTLLLALLLIVSFGCQDDEEVSRQATTKHDLQGYVQKGPFINGTAITVAELDQKLVATGKNFTTQIIDNKGSFSLKGVALQSDFVQLIAEGFYFDEVRGEKSAAQLTLFALADVSDVSSVNVNLLSHLEKDRVIYLMQEEELSFTTAKQQAQQEILAIFSIEKSDMMASELLDISQDGEDNAILLAISAILQGNNTVAELSELLADIITDIREDGVLDSESTREKIRTNAMSLTLADIRKHLEVRYEEMGVDATIADFEQYVDDDGDGFLNKDEDDTPDEFAFEAQVDVAINDTVTSNAITVSGLKEGGITRASVAHGWLVINGSVVPRSATGVNQSDTLSVAEVKNGDQLQVRLVSSSKYADTTKALITVGTLIKQFQVVTDDYSPDAFSFDPTKKVGPGTTYVSETITLTGLAYPAPILINEGVLFINGKEVSDIGRFVKTGDQITIQLFAGHEFEASAEAKLDIGSFTISLVVETYSSPLRVKPVFPVAIGDEGASFSIGKYVYVKGSSSMDNDPSDKQFFRYDTETEKWEQLSDFPGTPRNGAVSFSINGKGYIGLGYSSQVGLLKDWWVYDPERDLWNQSADFPGEARQQALTFVIENNAYVGLGKYSNKAQDFWKFNSLTNTWTRISDFEGEWDYGTFSFSIGSKGYVGESSPVVTSFLWEYEPATDEWTKKVQLPTEEGLSQGGTGLSLGNKGYFIPGYTDYAYEYDATDNKWSEIRTEYYGTVFSTGTSAAGKGYLIDQGGSFYEFTPPQD